MHILLTNDDGITSRGLFEAKLALERHGSVSVIAPDSNRSGSARSITIDRPLTVAEVELRDGSIGFATDGTPVDCVRFGELGLVGERPDLIVSGINYGYNLGDDVTYSGTVAAAFEGILLGIQGIAISQGAPTASGSDFRRHEDYDFGPAADFLGELVGRVIEHGLPVGHGAERERAVAARTGWRWAGWASASTPTRWSRRPTRPGTAATASTATSRPTTTSPAPTSGRSPRARSRSRRSTST